MFINAATKRRLSWKSVATLHSILSEGSTQNLRSCQYEDCIKKNHKSTSVTVFEVKLDSIDLFCMIKITRIFWQSLTAMTSRKNKNRRNILSCIFFSRFSFYIFQGLFIVKLVFIFLTAYRSTGRILQRWNLLLQ